MSDGDREASLRDEDGDLPSLLAAFDADLKQGAPASGQPPTNLSPSARMQWERARACLRMLEEAWPRQGRDSSVAAQAGPQPTATSVPRLLGRFELRRELGRGGFGVVYHAYDPQLGRDVALKVPHSHVLGNPDLRSRFQREARAAAGLDHPNIVPVYEAGEIDAMAYIALAYCPGITLHEWLRKRKASIPVSAIAEFMARLARAVHYAHEQGIIHRDLKPANILLGKESSQATASPDSSILSPDAAKITDFGLAKHLDDGEQTRTGTIAGTPCYMAPEQTGQKGSAIGPATDVYALGAILYELLTGRAPFQGETVLDTLDQVRNQDPVSPSRLRRGIPRDLVTICLTCLRKEPGRRYATALALAEDLERFLNHQTIRARPAGLVEKSAKWARRQPALAGLIATVVLVATFGFTFVVWQLRKTAAALGDAEKAQAETRAQNYLNQVALAHHELLTHHVGEAERLLAECPTEQRGWEWRHLKRLCQTDLFTLPGHASEVRAVAYSPDAQLIAVGCGKWWPGNDQGELKVWDAQSGKELHSLERDLGTAFAVAFSPDSRLLVSGGRSAKVVLWDPRSGKRLSQLSGHTSTIHGLAFSPDGRRLASCSADFTVRIWDTGSWTHLHLLQRHQAPIWTVAFSPDGRYLVSADWYGVAHLWDSEKGEHVRQLGHVVDLRAVAFSPDNTWLVAGSWDGTIWVWDMNKLDAPPVARHSNAGPIYDLKFGPDGRRLAFCSQDGGVKIWDFPSSKEVHAFAGHDGIPLSLAFSPDGCRLATGGADGTVKIWDATMPEDNRRAVEDNATVLGLTYADDGRLLALGNVGRNVKAWDSLTGASVISVPNQGVPLTAITSSRDGRWLVWAASNKTLWAWDESVQRLAWSLPIDAPPATGLAISADGSTLAWGESDGRIHVGDTAIGQVNYSLRENTSAVAGVAFHPNGHRLAAVTSDGTFHIWDLAAKKQVAQFGGQSRHAFEQNAEEAAPGPSVGRVTRLAYSPDGQRLVAVTRIRPVEIWDTTTGRMVLMIDQSVEGADCGAFSPDGLQLAAGREREVRLWETTEQPRAERLRLAAARALTWHRREAQQYRNDHHWFGALWHVNQLIIGADVGDAALYRLRAESLAELGQWKQSLADNTKAIELGDRGSFSWYDQACLALQLGDRATYRQTCAEALEYRGMLDRPDAVNTIAWISLISPDAGGDPLRIVELAEQAVAKKPQSYSYLNTLGAAWYRAGQYAEAIAQFERAIKAHESKEGMYIDWLFLAMAHARLGEHDHARSWLDKALGAPEPAKWQERLEQRLLRQEAEQIVQAVTRAD